jgi:hypothetical protein
LQCTENGRPTSVFPGLFLGLIIRRSLDGEGLLLVLLVLVVFLAEELIGLPQAAK